MIPRGSQERLPASADHRDDFDARRLSMVAPVGGKVHRAKTRSRGNLADVSACESPAHLELKRLALIWAQVNGYPIVACEVSLPNLRFRLDVGAYRPGSRRELRRDPRLNTNRSVATAAVGIAAIFECKANRPDLVRDCRSAARLIERMKVAHGAASQLGETFEDSLPFIAPRRWTLAGV